MNVNVNFLQSLCKSLMRVVISEFRVAKNSCNPLLYSSLYSSSFGIPAKGGKLESN